jgi:hypothetical protein
LNTQAVILNWESVRQSPRLYDLPRIVHSRYLVVISQPWLAFIGKIV